MSDKLVGRFTALVERAFSQNMEKLANHDFNKYQHLFKDEYDTAIKIVISIKDSKVLAELMKSYLTLYERYAANKDNIHFYRSEQLFELLVEQSGKVTDETLFEAWDALLATSSQTESFKQRFADLSPASHSNVEKFRRDEREKRRKRRSILDLLRDEYTRQAKSPPQSNDELYDFNPRPASAQAPLEIEIARVMKLWNLNKGKFTKENVGSLDKALNAFVDYMKAQGKADLLSLFQAIRQLRLMMTDKIEQKSNPKNGRTETHRTGGDPHERVMLYALYAIACIELLAVAQAAKLYVRNRLGFTAEETAFFYKPVAQDGFHYQSNILKVLSAPFEGTAIAVGQMKAFLNAYVLTVNQLRGCELVPLNKTMEIQEKWRATRDITDLIDFAVRRKDIARVNEIFADPKHATAVTCLTEIGSTRVDVKNPWVLGQKTLAAGSTIGSHNKFGDVAVVYIDPKNINQIFIEFSTLRPQLFLVHRDYVDDKVYGEAIMEIYRSTIGVVQLTELIFAAMGFLPVLIEAGFAGLIYEVALAYVGEKVEELASEIDPTFGKILGFLVQTLAHRPDFKPKFKTDILTRVDRADRTVLNDVLMTRATEKSFLNRAVEPPSRAISGGLPKPALPGPAEHFPFGGGGQPLPKLESPNMVYRIMSNDEAAKALKTQQMPPPIAGAEGERFVSLDSDYSALFREKELADIERKFGKQVEGVEKSLTSIDDRIAQLKDEGTPNLDAIAKLNGQRNKLLAAQKERGLASRVEAEKVIDTWHKAEGQQVVVEFELQPGAVDEMLGKSVDIKHWGEYSRSGKDVYLWKLERGYGRNIGIPKWQLDSFNGQIKSVRMSGFKQPLGKIKVGLGNN